jgi:quinol monooxygenase YgiN
MVVSIMDVTPVAERRTEVFQTLASLAQMIRREKGCLRCDFCIDSEDDTAFSIIEEWRNREEFDGHLRSPVFGILLGLSPLLKRPMGVSICTAVSREGMEAVKRARGHAVVAHD